MTSTPRSFHLDVDGISYELTITDFTGADDLAIFRETGCTVMDIFSGSKLSLFTLAALLWRHRIRNGEPTLTYAAVNEQLSFEDLESVTDEGPTEGTPAPQA